MAPTLDVLVLFSIIFFDVRVYFPKSDTDFTPKLIQRNLHLYYNHLEINSITPQSFNGNDFQGISFLEIKWLMKFCGGSK